MTDAVKPDNLPPVPFADAGGEEAAALPCADVLEDQQTHWGTQLPTRHFTRPRQQQSPVTDDNDDEAISADGAALRALLSAALHELDSSTLANDSTMPTAPPTTTLLEALNALLHDVELQLQHGGQAGIASELDLDLDTLHRILTQLRSEMEWRET